MYLAPMVGAVKAAIKKIKPKPKITPAEATLAVKLYAIGIVNPFDMLSACRESGLRPALAASILMQESGGGHNEWGHDPTIFIGGVDVANKVHYGETVTKKAYKAYLKQRGPDGAGGMQGVGPCQLTWYSHQDAADKLGGCWVPLHNMTVGFNMLAELVKQDGLEAGVAAYNGSGSAAEAYSQEVLARATAFGEKLA